jgi:PAS domain-containing protein
VRFEDGTSIDLLGNVEPLLDDNGRPQGAVAVLSDVTASRQAESELRESEERFRRVFEEGPLGLALVGKDYRFVKVNSALCQMVGYDEAELVQMSFVAMTHPDDVQADVELAERLFKREIPSIAYKSGM